MPVLTGRVDIANARLRFANGCIANLTASRISRDRVRKIRFFQPAAYLSIDYAAQKVEVWRLVQGRRRRCRRSKAASCRCRTRSRSSASWRTSSTPSRRSRAPLVTGEDGRRALALAQQITDKMAPSVATQTRRHEARKRSSRASIDLVMRHVLRPRRLPRRPRQAQAAGAHRRAGQPRSRDRRGHRPRLQDRRAAGRRCCSRSRPASTCRSRPTSSDRSSGCASRSA